MNVSTVGPQSLSVRNLMGGSSLLAKATTALQAAAAKADRAITEFKADFKSDSSKGTDGKLPPVGDSEAEKSNEAGLRQRILSRKSSIGDAVDEKSEGRFRPRILPRKPEKDFLSAVSVIEGDEELKAQDFWKRYFSSLKTIKQDLLDRDSEVRVSDDLALSVDLTCSADSPKKDPIEEEDYKRAFSLVSIPPSLLLRRLAAAADENGKSAKAMKNAVQKSRSLDKDNPSISGEWTGLVTGLAMVRKLSQKDGKFRSNCHGNRGSNHALMFALFEADIQLDEKDETLESVSPPKKMRLPQEIHGAPPESFVAKLAELMGGMRSEQKMAEFWMEVITELRRRWFAGEPIPRMPVDASPDLRYCSVHQQLQLINCCMARRKRRASTLASLPEAQLRGFQPLDESHMSLETPGNLPADGQALLESAELYAKQRDGQLLLRLGADHPADDLRMLETGEPVYSPLTQESPVFTEDSIREAEELVLRTGSVGAGCSHLLSDMQAFKAANPGCILEDFVRWYSPPDWREDPESGLNLVNICDGHDTAGAEASLRGYLSARMQSKGNLWQELWSSARPVPAVWQSPLFDEELAGESTLDALENIPPHDLFKQLFTAAFSVGYAIVEGSEAAQQDPLRTCLQECSDFIIYTCGRGTGGAALESMCKAYEVLEAAVLMPLDEVPETQGRQWLSTLKAFKS